MEGTHRVSLETIEEKLQREYKNYINVRIDECLAKKLQVRLVISLDNGKIMSIQDQAIIAGVSVLDIYSKRVLE